MLIRAPRTGGWYQHCGFLSSISLEMHVHQRHGSGKHHQPSPAYIAVPRSVPMRNFTLANARKFRHVVSDLSWYVVFDKPRNINGHDFSPAGPLQLPVASASQMLTELRPSSLEPFNEWEITFCNSITSAKFSANRIQNAERSSARA